jgi:hypothetical protein
MGRLDDIVARNEKAQGKHRVRGLGVIGSAIDATLDPTDTAEDRSRKLLAWMIAGGIVVAVLIVVAIAL